MTDTNNPPAVTSTRMPTFTDMLEAAQKTVHDKVLFNKFIKGTPLENDIPVWLVEFSRLWRIEFQNVHNALLDDFLKLHEDNTRLREALESIEKGHDWATEIAREALKGPK